jgi:hypothetical protein
MKSTFWKDHCLACGEWLQGLDMCPECGPINKKYRKKNYPHATLSAFENLNKNGISKYIILFQML